MDDDQIHIPEVPDDAEPIPQQPEPQPVPQHAHAPYQRKRAAHKTQPAIDDLAQDGDSADLYTHDSNITIKGRGPLSNRDYRRSRSSMPQIQRSVRYGQYLEVPKGRRAIFSSRERKRRRNSILVIIAVVIVLALLAIFVFNFMGN